MASCESSVHLTGRVAPTGGIRHPVGTAKVPVLLLELAQPISLVRGQARAQTPVDLGASDPTPERLCLHAEQARDLDGRRPCRGRLAPALLDHPDGTLTCLRRVPHSFVGHGPILSGRGLQVPGAVQNDEHASHDGPRVTRAGVGTAHARGECSDRRPDVPVDPCATAGSKRGGRRRAPPPSSTSPNRRLRCTSCLGACLVG